MDVFISWGIDRRVKSSASTSALLSAERNWRELGRISTLVPIFEEIGPGVKAGEDYMHIIRVVGGRVSRAGKAGNEDGIERLPFTAMLYILPLMQRN
jgi:hypothetical protein